MNSLMTDRQLNILNSHQRFQEHWQHQQSVVHTKRQDPQVRKLLLKDHSQTSFHSGRRSPCEVSLMERSSEYRVPHDGSRFFSTFSNRHECAQHEKSDDCENQARRDKYQQSFRNADVLYRSVDRRSQIFITVPVKRELRQDFERVKKARIALKNKFQGPTLKTSQDEYEEEPLMRYNSKATISVKRQAQFLPELK